MSTIITISRQFGSGGRVIGKNLAEELDLPFCDKEIIDLAAEKSGLASKFISENEQKMSGMNFYAFGSTFMGGNIWSNVENIETKIFAYEAEAIKKLAKQGPCVIVGRCADFILKDEFQCFNVFIHADMESRKKRIIDVYNLADDPKRAERLIKNTDRMRAKHHSFYTDTVWDEASNYHLTLESAKLGIDNCVKIIKDAYLLFDASNSKPQN